MRGLVGFVKHQFAYKNVKFDGWYFGMMMLISAFVGMSASWAVANSGIKFTIFEEINPAIAFIVGYAGGDLIENFYKIMLGRDSLYTPGKKK